MPDDHARCGGLHVQIAGLGFQRIKQGGIEQLDDRAALTADGVDRQSRHVGGGRSICVVTGQLNQRTSRFKGLLALRGQVRPLRVIDLQPPQRQAGFARHGFPQEHIIRRGCERTPLSEFIGGHSHTESQGLIQGPAAPVWLPGPRRDHRAKYSAH